MNKTTKIILLCVAAFLIAGGIGAFIFALAQDLEPAATKDPSTETTEVIHADTEYIYDDDGNLKSEVYYKDNVYNGRKDYYSGENADYITVFDKDYNEISSTVTEFNTAGSIITVTTYENHEITKTVEYDYHYDLRTPAKKTVKTYEGEDEYAQKTYYTETGVKTRVCEYLNGTLTAETFYDEAGNIVENGGETVEE